MHLQKYIIILIIVFLRQIFYILFTICIYHQTGIERIELISAHQKF